MSLSRGLSREKPHFLHRFLPKSRAEIKVEPSDRLDLTLVVNRSIVRAGLTFSLDCDCLT